jgi:hypothetical protein
MPWNGGEHGGVDLQKGGKCSAEIMGGLMMESALGFSLSDS